MKKLHMVTFALLLIGGLNWLLVGLLSWDVGELLGGQGAMLSRLIYVLVGVSAIVEAATHKSNCKCCCGDKEGCCKKEVAPAPKM